jgi:hypothetical protein
LTISHSPPLILSWPIPPLFSPDYTKASEVFPPMPFNSLY